MRSKFGLANKQNNMRCKQKSKNIEMKNDNSNKKVVQCHKDAAILGLLKTMSRFGICLNNKTSSNALSNKFDKVCFMLINSYEKKNSDLGIGPINNGIHVGLYHHRLDYKVFYLYNPQSDDYIKFLNYFLQNTTESLTIFYSGLDSASCGIHEIEFVNGKLSSNIIKNVISQNCNGKAQIIFITDSYNGGSVYDIHSINHINNKQPTNAISFHVKKDGKSLDRNEKKRSHGIFIYYFFKIIGDNPNITPKDLVDNINPSILPFNEVLKYETTNTTISDSPLFTK